MRASKLEVKMAATSLMLGALAQRRVAQRPELAVRQSAGEPYRKRLQVLAVETLVC